MWEEMVDFSHLFSDFSFSLLQPQINQIYQPRSDLSRNQLFGIHNIISELILDWKVLVGEEVVPRGREGLEKFLWQRCPNTLHSTTNKRDMIISLTFLNLWIYLLYNLGNKNHDLVNCEEKLPSNQIFTFSEIEKNEVHISSHSTDIKWDTMRV